MNPKHTCSCSCDRVLVLVVVFVLIQCFTHQHVVLSCSTKGAQQSQPQPQLQLKIAETNLQQEEKPETRPISNSGHLPEQDGPWKNSGGGDTSMSSLISRQGQPSPPNDNNNDDKNEPTSTAKTEEVIIDDDEPPTNNYLTPYTSSTSSIFHKKPVPLTLVQFANKSVQCNDGTTAGYYARYASGKNANTWIIFLEGGWFCFDERSCQNRWLRLKNLMTSSGWPHYKHVGGILSPDPTENPYWWNANHVFVPYCSSDTWSGTTTSEENGTKFSFMGALILDEVIKSLVRSGGIRPNSSVILAGSSAGGTGVLINLDRVESLLDSMFKGGGTGSGSLRSPGTSTSVARVRGISDSGWFIDKLPSYAEKVNCHDVIFCPPEISLKKGMNLWNARLPESCQNSYPDEPWSCFFGYRIYPSLKASLFVFQWMFDEAQMLVNNVPTPALKKEEWDYVYKVGDELRKTLINVTNVFIPACMAHTVLTHRDWRRVEVNSVYLPRALKCWESGGVVGESNQIPSERQGPDWDLLEDDGRVVRTGRRRNPKSNSNYLSTSSSKQSDFPAQVNPNSNPSSRGRNGNRRRHNNHNHNNNRHQNQNQKRPRERMGNKHKSLRKKNKNRDKSLQSRNNQSLSSEIQIHQSPHHRLRKRQRKIRHNEGRRRGGDPEEEEEEPFGDHHLHNNRVRSRAKALRTNRHSSSSSSSNNNNNQLTSSNRVNHLRGNNRNPNSNSNNHHRRNRRRRWFSVCDAGRESTGGGGGGSYVRLIERCSWPQCNKSCPKLLNPLTGEEVDFKDLLKSFGLDMTTVAKALGIDIYTLNSMDHQALLQMLTQNA